ncbi:hypothetical protein ANACOL_03838 [Anaerotruncus colihominis DSM 17241]|uniref:Uncharacterized protein n=1 Tax=Anaerotruncus colihominis DSM 17241 TaxID=445972 RepID=B0PGA5_9FIRM|nr:hypothetical protein ANACOL_03838 [Anaerotruncus colihominis DSM 17241]
MLYYRATKARGIQPRAFFVLEIKGKFVSEIFIKFLLNFIKTGLGCGLILV